MEKIRLSLIAERPAQHRGETNQFYTNELITGEIAIANRKMNLTVLKLNKKEAEKLGRELLMFAWRGR